MSNNIQDDFLRSGTPDIRAVRKNNIIKSICCLSLNIFITPLITYIILNIVGRFIAYHMQKGDKAAIQDDVIAGVVIIIVGILTFWLICFATIGLLCYSECRYRRQRQREGLLTELQ